MKGYPKVVAGIMEKYGNTKVLEDPRTIARPFVKARYRSMGPSTRNLEQRLRRTRRG